MKSNLKTLEGKKVLVIGLGESGFGAALLLKEMGAEVRVTDSKAHEKILEYAHRLPSQGLELELGGHTENFCRDIDFAILSPGVPKGIPLLKWLKNDHVPIWGEFEWASRFLPDKIIAVTGSNGKSTTSTLIWEILKRRGVRSSLAGNIGRSVSRAIVEDIATQIWVLEVSSFQLEGIEEFRPWISLLLNITPNHLDHYACYEDYTKVKLNIFKNQKESDWAILNRSLSSYAPLSPKLLWINRDGAGEEGCSRGCYMSDDQIKCSFNGDCQNILALSDLPLRGDHFAENVMFAAMASRLCGIHPDVVSEAVMNFKGLEHRQEILEVLEVKGEGVCWVNDSKATSVDAVRSALEAFDCPVIWIAGGRYKGGDFEGLKGLISKKVKEAYFYGEAAHLIRGFVNGACSVFVHENLETVMNAVRLKVSSGDTVLFSPGCSSFDQFQNFEERGKHFKNLCNVQPITCSM